MKKIVLFCMSVILVASLYAKKELIPITKNFNAKNLTTIDIKSGNANIYFAGADTKEIIVKIDKFNKDKCYYDISIQNSTLFIKVKNKRTFFLVLGDFCGYIEVKSPKNIKYKIKNGSGDTKGANINRQTDISVGSGNMDLINIKGDIYLKSGSGDINVANIDGDSILKTGSGDISMANVLGKVTASTGSGDIDGILNSRNVTVHTGSGDTKLSGLLGSLDHKSGSGSLTAYWKKPVTEGSVNFRIGSGDIDLCFPESSKIKTDFRSGSGREINKIGFMDDHKFVIYGKTGSGDLYISKCR